MSARPSEDLVVVRASGLPRGMLVRWRLLTGSVVSVGNAADTLSDCAGNRAAGVLQSSCWNLES